MEIVIKVGGEHRPAHAEEGESLLDVLRREHVHVDAACGGIGSCAQCWVLVRSRSGSGYRLACATRVEQGMEVQVDEPQNMAVEQAGAVRGAAAGPAEEFAAGPALAASAHAAPQDEDGALGMALDIGTTTLAARLHDLATGELLASAGRMNPQVAFGSDVVSRISASMRGELGLMTDALRDALVQMRGQLAAQAGVDEGRILRTSAAGNTVMQHIAAGLAPDSIGTAPYEPRSLFGDVHELAGLGEVRFARCVCGYVGGDVVAGMVARGMDGPGTRLFVDVGTNGEMALAHGGRILCCATAAGPVFEGAGLRFGMPARAGAVAKAGFAGGELRLQVIGGVRPAGICGSGIVDIVALMLKLGIIDESGRLLGSDEVRHAHAGLVGAEDGQPVFYLMPERSLYVTQDDVRNVQLAKAAVCAGVRTLMEAAGIGPHDVEALELAGGFGRHLDLRSAARIGLFPSELSAVAQSVGNTSIEGASQLLLFERAREREARVAQRCDYIELATSSAFGERYIRGLGFAAA